MADQNSGIQPGTSGSSSTEMEIEASSSSVTEERRGIKRPFPDADSFFTHPQEWSRTPLPKKVATVDESLPEPEDIEFDEDEWEDNNPTVKTFPLHKLPDPNQLLNPGPCQPQPTANFASNVTENDWERTDEAQSRNRAADSDSELDRQFRYQTAVRRFPRRHSEHWEQSNSGSSQGFEAMWEDESP